MPDRLDLIIHREGLWGFADALAEAGLLECSVDSLQHAGIECFDAMLGECAMMPASDVERVRRAVFGPAASPEKLVEGEPATREPASGLPPWIAAVLESRKEAKSLAPVRENEEEEEEELGTVSTLDAYLDMFDLSSDNEERSSAESIAAPIEVVPRSETDWCPRAAFVGTARDCEAHLAACFRNMEAIADRCFDGEVGYVFFENDSKDGTAAALRRFAASGTAGRRWVLEERGLDTALPKRTHRLAHARNRLLGAVAERGWLARLEVLVVFDMDDVNGAVSLGGFEEALQAVTRHRAEPGSLDVATANQADRYYDRWALRTHAAPGNTWARLDLGSNINKGLEYFFPPGCTLPAACEVRRQRISVTSAVVPVRSAFGGLALYRAAVLRDPAAPSRVARGVRYTGEDGAMLPGRCFAWLEGQDCEHALFHASLAAAWDRTRAARTGAAGTSSAPGGPGGGGGGPLRIGIVPRLVNGVCDASGTFAPRDSTIGATATATKKAPPQGPPLSRDPLAGPPAPRATVAVNADGSYAVGLEGIVSYTRSYTAGHE